MTPTSRASEAKVAVITRTRDRPLLLARAAESIYGQSFRDFHWVIVNDGGAGAPAAAAAETARAKGVAVTVINHEYSRGIEAASNAAIARASSEFIVIHDDDDRWEPTFLATTVAALDRHPDHAGVVTAAVRVVERIDGETVTELERAPFNDWAHGIYLVDMAQRNLFPPIAFLFRRSFYQEVGGFDETLPVLGDWDFNLKVLARADIGFLPEPLACYHIRTFDGVPNGTNANMVTGDISRFQEYDRVIRNRLLRADFARGAIGLGWLVNLGRQHHAMWESLRRLATITASREP